MADINDRLDRLQRRLEFDRLSADPAWTPHPPEPQPEPGGLAATRPAGVDDRLGEVLDAVASVVARHPGLSVMVAVADGRTGRPVVRVSERDGSAETGVVVTGPGAGTAPTPAAQTAAVPTMSPARGQVIPGEAVLPGPAPLPEPAPTDDFGRRPPDGLGTAADPRPDAPAAGGGPGDASAGVRFDRAVAAARHDRPAEPDRPADTGRDLAADALGGRPTAGHDVPAGFDRDRRTGDVRYADPDRTPTTGQDRPDARYDAASGDVPRYERAAGGIRYDVPTEGRDGVRLDRAGDNAGYDRTLAGQRPGAAGFLFEDRSGTGATGPAPEGGRPGPDGPGPGAAHEGAARPDGRGPDGGRPVGGRSGYGHRPDLAAAANGRPADGPAGAAYRPDPRSGDGRPDDARPGTDRPDGGGRPDAGRPGTDRPDGRLDTGRPDTGRPGTDRLDADRPDAGLLDAGRPDAGRPGTDRPDDGRPDDGRSEGRPEAGRHAAQDERGVGSGWSGTSWHHSLWSRPTAQAPAPAPAPAPAQAQAAAPDPGAEPARQTDAERAAAQDEVPAPPGGTIPLAEDTSEVVSRLAQLLRENPTLTSSWSREAPE